MVKSKCVLKLMVSNEPINLDILIYIVYISPTYQNYYIMNSQSQKYNNVNHKISQKINLLIEFKFKSWL